MNVITKAQLFGTLHNTFLINYRFFVPMWSKTFFPDHCVSLTSGSDCVRQGTLALNTFQGAKKASRIAVLLSQGKQLVFPIMWYHYGSSFEIDEREKEEFTIFSLCTN